MLKAICGYFVFLEKIVWFHDICYFVCLKNFTLYSLVFIIVIIVFNSLEFWKQIEIDIRRNCVC
jgi:hypothetical protein